MSDILDTKRAEKQKKNQEFQRKKELSDWKKILSQPEGRRVVWRILGWSGVYNDPMTGNSQTFYNVGAQSVGRRILDEVFEADHPMFAQMQGEAISAAKSKKEKDDE